MVKLASARQSRMYGPRQGRSRAEYMNAGLYVFATIMLVSGFAAQLSKEPKSAPRKKRVNGYFKLEKQALNMLIAGPVLWVLGSIHKSFQIYERADGHLQILQQSVHIPFLMGPEPVVPCGCNYQLQREDWINPSRLGVIGARVEFSTALSFPETSSVGKYLGCPHPPVQTDQAFFSIYIIEKIEAKLAGWKSKHLSLAGGLGLRKTRNNNMVAMAELNWKLSKRVELLWVRVLKGRYRSTLGLALSVLKFSGLFSGKRVLLRLKSVGQIPLATSKPSPLSFLRRFFLEFTLFRSKGSTHLRIVQFGIVQPMVSSIANRLTLSFPPRMSVPVSRGIGFGVSLVPPASNTLFGLLLMIVLQPVRICSYAISLPRLSVNGVQIFQRPRTMSFVIAHVPLIFGAPFSFLCWILKRFPLIGFV
ncbi:hypothetical protein RHSIM_Rhsim04G0082700 [Rhododendron simsii]|uniref:Uncharacterized protein n=1 Tax=Rhododendron simsii TaxID=118357 RepID=A0A834H420_RHOSS|nr:hypothetical protein RHSIM_Rhsim04G0082700 [Rhododendron simsii]